MTTGRQMGKTNRFRMLVVLVATILAATMPAVALAAPGSVQWTRQFGTTNQDIAQGVATYGPEEYVVGLTWGAFSGNVNKGQDDIFVRRYDKDGSTVWFRQLGSSDSDEARSVAVTQGGVYVAGEAGGALPSNSDKGGTDAFIVKYNHAGDLLWSKQFGTGDIDGAYGIGVDSTGVYVAGTTHGAFQGESNAGFSDVFVRKYNFQGSVVWTDQFGSPKPDLPHALDAHNTAGVYVAGFTGGTLPNKTNQGQDDAFVRRYHTDGTDDWTRQFGSSGDDYALGIAADSSGVYVGGQTKGALEGQNTGDSDAFIRRYSHGGPAGWTDQFGTADFDTAYGIGIDAPRGLQEPDPPLVYVAGSTTGTLGESNQGSSDAYTRAYEKDGDSFWTAQFGTRKPDSARAVAGVGSSAYVAGRTDGAFDGQTSKGVTDAFLRKYD
jgi:hypothetical protein